MAALVLYADADWPALEEAPPPLSPKWEEFLMAALNMGAGLPSIPYHEKTESAIAHGTRIVSNRQRRPSRNQNSFFLSLSLFF